VPTHSQVQTFHWAPKCLHAIYPNLVSIQCEIRGHCEPVSRTHDDIKWGCDGVERCCLHENALPLSVQASLCVQLHTVTPYPHSSPSHFNFTESVFNASYLCFHLREWAINTQKHSQVISYWLGYWILHLVLACSYVLDFCSFLQWLSGTVYLALPSFAVANSETLCPCYSMLQSHSLPSFAKPYHTFPTYAHWVIVVKTVVFCCLG